MELMAVMAVMGLLATLAVTSYFSAIRGMNKRRAADTLYKALVSARQRACVDSSQIQFLCFNVWSGAELTPEAQGDRVKQLKALSPTYVVCKELGRVTYRSGSLLGDEFTPLNSLIGATAPTEAVAKNNKGRMRLFNLTEGDWSDVSMQVVSSRGYDIASATTIGEFFPDREQMLWCFVMVDPRGVNWKVGDVYGIEAAPLATLPQNVFFGSPIGTNPGGNEKPLTIRFFPDGGAEKKTIRLSAMGSSVENLPDFTSITVDDNGTISPPTSWR